MIYIRIINHEFKYAIIDMIKSFYGNMPIQFLEYEQELDEDAVIITSELEVLGKTALCVSKYFCRDIYKVKEEKDTVNNTLEEDRELKRLIKISLLKLLVDVTGEFLPWGILTGIRPVKIVHAMLEKGMDCKDIYNELSRKYYVTDDRIKLSLNVAKKQEKHIESIRDDTVSIYIGIPFCPSRCYYCSFISNTIDSCGDLIHPYINALKKEISEVSAFLLKNNTRVQSIYIGGGTPTSLGLDSIEELLTCINRFWPKKQEFTCEAGRPDTIDERKLICLKNKGINRISINPQTTNDKTLKRIARGHTRYEIFEKFNLARTLGFDNINMDMILGLPGESISDIKKTSDDIIKLNPENITVHILALKKASLLDKYNWNCKLDNKDISDMVDYTREIMDIKGMYPYYLYRQKHMAGNFENLGYCKEGFECIYNIQIMEERQSIVSFGANAVTKVVFNQENRIERQFNIKDIKLYIERIDQQIEKKISLLKELYINRQ